MTVIEQIKDQLKSSQIVLYIKGTPEFPQCGFSAQAINALKSCDAKVTYINILDNPEVREALKEYSKWPTYPQLYINGTLIGGSDIIMDMHSKGELQTMVLPKVND